MNQSSWFAKEARATIAFLIVALLLAHGMWGLMVLPLWLPVLLYMFIMRDRTRVVPSEPLGLIAPVDGLVNSISRTHDPYLDRQAVKLSLTMNWTGSYALRSVTEGKILEHWFNNKPLKDNSLSVHAHTVWIQTDENDDIVLAIHPARLMNKIACYLSIGERVGQGQRCGFIPLGSDVDIYLPDNSNIQIEENVRVVSGETILAKLVHE